MAGHRTAESVLRKERRSRCRIHRKLEHVDGHRHSVQDLFRRGRGKWRVRELTVSQNDICLQRSWFETACPGFIVHHAAEFCHYSTEPLDGRGLHGLVCLTQELWIILLDLAGIQGRAWRSANGLLSVLYVVLGKGVGCK